MQNKILKIMLAIVACATATLAILAETSSNIPVFKHDIKKGEFITADDISESRYLKMTLSEDVYDKGIDIVGKAAEYDIPASVPVPKVAIKEVIKEENIEPSDDAIVAIAINYERVPSDLEVDDEVNIITYFADGAIKDTDAFASVINEKAKVVAIRKDETGHITNVDVAIDKMIAPKIVTCVSLGNVFIAKNVTDNDIELAAISAKDIYEQSFAHKNIEIVTEEGGND